MVADKRRLAETVLARPPQAREGEQDRGWYDDTKFEEGRPLTRKDIDEAVPDLPVFVQHRGGHAAVENSRAIELVGLTIDTPDPVGGRYYRENGEFTGKIAEPSAMHIVDIKVLRTILGGRTTFEP